jgi:hypothetical protein
MNIALQMAEEDFFVRLARLEAPSDASEEHDCSNSPMIQYPMLAHAAVQAHATRNDQSDVDALIDHLTEAPT